MPAYNDTVDDFNLKWANTWAYHGDKIVYVYGAHYDEDEEHLKDYYVILQEYLEAVNKKTRHDNFDLNSLTPVLVDSQFFNCSNFELDWIKRGSPACLFVARNSRRQNKRSISDENTYVYSPLVAITSKMTSQVPRTYGISKPYIDQILAHQFPAYLQALELCQTQLMVALSPSFAISLSTISSDKYLLSNQFGFIGEADAHTLYIHHQGSIQEIYDFVSRNKLDLEIINASHLAN